MAFCECFELASKGSFRICPLFGSFGLVSDVFPAKTGKRCWSLPAGESVCVDTLEHRGYGKKRAWNGIKSCRWNGERAEGRGNDKQKNRDSGRRKQTGYQRKEVEKRHAPLSHLWPLASLNT